MTVRKRVDHNTIERVARKMLRVVRTRVRNIMYDSLLSLGVTNSHDLNSHNLAGVPVILHDILRGRVLTTDAFPPGTLEAIRRVMGER